MSTRPPLARLSLSDGMLLIGATAISLAGFILVDDHLFDGGRHLFGLLNWSGVPSSATFYLAKIQPQYAGATLSLQFFDIADTAGSATMTVQPPTDSNYSTFPSCAFVKDASPPTAISSSGCSVSGLTSAQYDARIITLSLVVPTDYTCNTSVATGCWLKVKLDFTGAPADTTTWSASLLGDPVRLVE